MNLSTSNSKNKIAILLLSFFITSSAFVYHNYSAISKEHIKRLEVEKFWTNKTFINDSFDILIFGNSRIYRGINPRSDIQKRKIYNMGYSGAGLNPQLISHYVEKNLKENGVIVLGISATVFMDSAFENNHWKQYVKLKPDEVFLNKNINFKMFFSSYFDKFTGPKKKEDSNHSHSFNQRTGFVASNSKIYNINKTTKRYKHLFKHVKFQEANLVQLINYLKTLKGYKIFAFRVPTHSEVESLEDIDAQFPFELVKKNLTQAGIQWLDIPFKDELKSYDGNHLDEKSANRLSKFIFSRI